jgi:hypothetical protein
MGSNSSGRQNEDYLKTQALGSTVKADTAIDAAGKADPFEQRRRDYLTKILDWQEGKSGPQDVKNFPDQTGMALYTDAKAVTDAGRVGKGYGTLSDGANPVYSDALGKELESERSLEASGKLEGYINNAVGGAQAEAGEWGKVGDARTMEVAGMRSGNANAAQDRYQAMLARKPPSFLRQLALGTAQGFAQGAGAGAV